MRKVGSDDNGDDGDDDDASPVVDAVGVVIGVAGFAAERMMVSYSTFFFFPFLLFLLPVTRQTNGYRKLLQADGCDQFMEIRFLKPMTRGLELPKVLWAKNLIRKSCALYSMSVLPESSSQRKPAAMAVRVLKLTIALFYPVRILWLIG